MNGQTRRPSAAARGVAYTLFAIVAAGALAVPMYNRVEPSIGGVPFFYWFQTAWILASAAATALAYRLRL
jgi:hypothetical protein